MKETRTLTSLTKKTQKNITLMKPYIKETIYGNQKRLDWILSHLKEDDAILEFGCGTGYMICYPLATRGYHVTGVDLDKTSIDYGKQLFEEKGIDPNTLRCENLSQIENKPNVIIASEVFEHILDDDLSIILSAIKNKLTADGRLLVTVPNGYGWFELESFLWFKAKFGKLIEVLRVDRIIRKIKSILFGDNLEDMTPSSLADSPHVQKFTYNSIKDMLEKYGFSVVSRTGAVLFAGPFSNLLFSGIDPILKLNTKLGGYFPKVASGFFISCKVKSSS